MFLEYQMTIKKKIFFLHKKMRVAVYSYRRHCRCRCRHYLSATFEESPEMISLFIKEIVGSGCTGEPTGNLHSATKKKEGGDLLNPGMGLERFS